MPTNATIGSTLGFPVTFFDGTGATTVPSSAQVTITYPPSSNSLTTVSCTIALTRQGNGNWLGFWGSGVAAAGLSSYTVSAAGNAAPSSGSGTLRLM